MAITENNKIKTEVVQTASTQQITGGSTTETKLVRKPIDMTQSATELKNNNSEIIKYLNSKEFKNLSPEEQLKAFKNKYGLGLSDEEANKLFNGSKKIAAEFNQRIDLENGTGSIQSASTQIQTSANSEISAKKDIVQTLKSQGIENPTEGDLYNYLTTQQQDGKELSPEQTKLLKTYNQLIDNGYQGLKTTEKNAAEKSTQIEVPQADNLVPLTTVLNKNFQTKPAKVKLNTFMDAYLTKNDAEYANLSGKEKEAYCAEKSAELAKTFGIQLDEKKLKNADKIANIQKTFAALATLEEANSKGEKISDFSDKSLAKNGEIALSNQIKKGIKTLMENEDFKNKSPEEQMLALGRLINVGDEKFAKLSEKEQLETIQKSALDQLSKINPELAAGLEALVETDGGQKQLCQWTSTFLKDFVKQPNDVTISKYKETLESNPIKTTNLLLKDCKNREIVAPLRVIRSTAEALKNEGKPYDYKAVAARLEEKCKNGTATKDDMQALRSLKGDFEGFGEEATKIRKLTEAKADLLAQGNISFEEMQNAAIKKYKNNPKKLSEHLAAGIRAMEGANKDPKAALDTTLELLRANGYSDAQIRKEFPTLIPAAGVNAYAKDNGVAMQQIIDVDPTNTSAKKLTNLAVNGDMSEEQSRKFGEATVQHGKPAAKSLLTTVLADRNLTTKERATSYISNVCNSGKVSPQNQSSWVKDYVAMTSVKNGAEDTLYAVKELAKQNNSAVTEGLAAAYNSVDKSIKSQYKSVIDNAVSSGNYTPEQKANIQNAMATGNISGSSTTNAPSETSQASSANSTTQTGTVNAQEVAKMVQTSPQAGASSPTPAQIVASALQSGRAEKLENTVSATAANSTTVGTSTIADASVKNSEINKAKAMDNAQQTKASIDNSIKKWEEEHNTKLSEKQITELKATVGAEVANDLLNNDAATEKTDVIEEIVSNSTSIADLYDKLVSIYGAKVQDKFIEALAINGSSDQISSFAQSTKNSDVIKNLYLKCDSAVLKSQLLNMLPPTTVSEMLNAGQIDDLSTIDYKLLVNYLMAHPSMSNGEFNKYMQYLPFDERQRICKLRMKSTPSISETETNELVENTGVKTIDRAKTVQQNGPVKGSDEWQAEIRKIQSGIKVPPSQMYDSGVTSLDDEYLDVGAGSSTKVRFGGRYDKLTQKGAVYWG